MNKFWIAILLMFVVASLLIDDSDAWRRRRRRRRSGKMDENEMPVPADVSQEEIPENARQSIIAALTDQEASEDKPEEYDIHPKDVI